MLGGQQGRPPVIARSAGAGSLRLALALLALAGAALAGTQIALFASGPATPVWPLIAFSGVGVLYLLTGLLAWVRRPSNRTGALLCLGALSVFAAASGNTTIPALVLVGYIAAELPIGVLIHVLLAFPSGRLRSREARALAVAGYAVTVGLQVPQILFASDPNLPGWIRLTSRSGVVDLADDVQSAAGALIIVLAALLLARRLRRADEAQRRVLTAVYSYGVFTILFLVVSANVVRPLLELDPLTLFEIQLAVFAGLPVAFVTGVLRGGFARTGEIDELGAWLGAADGGRPLLRDALAQALGDASVELLFWLPDQDRYVDALGGVAQLPRAGSQRSAVDVELADRRVGAIVYDATLIADAGLVRSAGRVIALALDRERLVAELLAHQEALRDSRARIVDAGDRERRRIARDLHDGLQGRLVLLAMRAGQLDGAAELHAGLDEVIVELRQLVHGVMPALLLERGLYAAIEDLADRMPIGTRAELDDTDARMPPAIESAGYFIVAEALANAAKHSCADRVSVRLARPDGDLEIEIRDDGIGGATLGDDGAGLRSIADRVDVVGGRLRIESPVGDGTRLTAWLPCGS
jgi:signal transduction histidine kinase